MAKSKGGVGGGTRAEVVALRARCLYLVVLRGWAEAKKKQKSGKPRDALDYDPLPTWSDKDLYSLVKDAAQQVPFKKGLTSSERKLVLARLGSLPNFRKRESTHRAEGVARLMWCLGNGPDLVAYSPFSDLAYKALDPARDLSASPLELFATPHLRPTAQIKRQQALDSAWLWRARIAILPMTVAISGDALDDRDKEVTEFFKALVAKRAAACAASGLFEPIKDDFPVDKKPFQKAVDRLLSPDSVELIYRERVRALNWALDPTQNWHKTETPTPLGKVMPKWMMGEQPFLKYMMNPGGDARWY